MVLLVLLVLLAQLVLRVLKVFLENLPGSVLQVLLVQRDLRVL
jgi:hypothetical protein